MDELTKRISRLMSPEAMAELEDYERRETTGYQSKSLRRLPPDPMVEKSGPVADLNDIGDADIDGLRELYLKSLLNVKLRFPPLEKLPCANVQVAQYVACENHGTLMCSACKLVSYCSKKCQGAHWKFHKRDCKNELRSEDWMPSWIIENRLPSFVNNQTTAEEFRIRQNDEFSTGASLWGNTSAIDVINLADNEKDSNRDLSLAFVASGDLRHVVHTIDALPSSYSGNLNILVNDGNSTVICRNIVLLLILGTISDEVIAADVALHFWYSAFIPMQYHNQISSALALFLKHGFQSERPMYPLGPHSTLSCGLFPENMKNNFLHFISASVTMSDAQDEYDRVRAAPSRSDLRDRMYIGLKPSHRVAFHEYRRFGIVLPFGAINAHFNSPNYSLFSLAGKWLQTDYADPLEGWDLSEITQAGKDCGAQPEDIYGCLYFFLSKKLRMFARRLRNFKINFRVFDFEACGLAEGIRQDAFTMYDIPASVRFDRIYVSNILDVNYVGMRRVLSHWAPLLAETSTAVIVGHFMNWIARQEDGRLAGANRSIREEIMKRTIEKAKLSVSMRNLTYIKNMVYTLPKDMDALYENSKPFANYLAKEGLEDILRKTNLKLREKHTIVAHRDLAPLEAPPDALPEFPTDEIWYYHTKLSTNSWLSRYVEFSRG